MKLPRMLGRSLILTLVTVAMLAVAYRLLLRATPVEVVKVESGQVEEVVRGPAQVRARIPVTVSARVTGTILNVAADEGDRVRRGQTLVRLDERDTAARAAATRAALARARADLALADSNERRDRQVFEQGYISAAAMEATTAQRAAKQAEVVAAQEDLRYAETLLTFARLTAPMDAVVVARLAEVGDTVAPGTPILRLVDPTTLQVVARIDESVVGRIHVGMAATIRLRSGGEAAGKVSRIGFEADAAARELAVEVAFDRPPERFAIDQEAEVAIPVGQARGLLVPLSAVVRQDGRTGVLVVREGRARFQPLELGASDDQRALAITGLTGNEIVVRRGEQIRPGARVRPAEGG
jgi:RND family efflux transporter MFP subunit